MADEDLSQMSGSALREKLEEALKQNRQMQSELTTRRAKDVLTEKGFDLVTPDDLRGVDAENIEAKAQEIQTQRQQLQADLLRKALEKQGIQGADLEDMVAVATGQAQARSDTAEAIGRVRGLGNGGEPVPDVNPEKLHGYDAVRTALENPKRRLR